MAVNVVDKHANVIVQKRMDGCIHVGIPEFSYAKAYTWVVTNLSSREFRDKYTSDEGGSNELRQQLVERHPGTLRTYPP